MLNLVGGAPVECTDGPCGVLGWIAIDPKTFVATHVAVEGRVTRNFGKLVPLERIASAADRIRLNCTKDEFEALGDADERHLAVTSYRGGVSLITTDDVPTGEIQVGGDEEIRATDGRAGKLVGLTIEDGGKVAALLIEIGHMSRKHKMSMPGDLIRSLDATGFDVALTKAQLADL